MGLLGLILVKVLAPGFYARQNIKTPVKIAVITLTATQLMNLAFIIPLRHAGLALAIGLGACLNAGMLYYKLRSHRILPAPAGMGGFYGKDSAGADERWVAVLWFGSGSDASWLVGPAFERGSRLGQRGGNWDNKLFRMLWLLGFRLKDFARRGTV